MESRNMIGLALVLVLFATSWFGVSAASRDLVIRHPSRRGVPMIYMVPAETTEAVRATLATGGAEPGAVSAAASPDGTAGDPRVPGVLIAHGHSASKQIMLGVAHAVAHAGYAVLVWDQPGHGANTHPFANDAIAADLETALQTLAQQPEVDPDRIALLGHSMGAGAVLDAGAAEPDRFRATVAISPPPGVETAGAPANVLLMAGSREPRYASGARELLQAYGGVRRGFDEGLARDLVVVSGAGHLTILFRSSTYRAVIDWLVAAVPAVPRTAAAGEGAGRPEAAGVAGEDGLTGVRAAVRPADSYVDRRLLWYALSPMACLLLLATMIPAARPDERAHMVSTRGRAAAVGLAVGAVVATAAVAWGTAHLDLVELGGMLYAGPLSLWFGITGIVWLLAGSRIRRPRRKDLVWIVFIFGLVWLGIGALSQQVWLQWGLTAERLWRWPLWAALCLPWFLAMEAAPSGRGSGTRAVWWLAECVVVVAGLSALIATTPELAMLRFVIPFLPVVLGLLAATGRVANRVWGFGVGSALAFGWIVASVFPYVG